MGETEIPEEGKVEEEVRLLMEGEELPAWAGEEEGQSAVEEEVEQAETRRLPLVPVSSGRDFF